MRRSEDSVEKGGKMFRTPLMLLIRSFSSGFAPDSEPTLYSRSQASGLVTSTH